MPYRSFVLTLSCVLGVSAYAADPATGSPDDIVVTAKKARAMPTPTEPAVADLEAARAAASDTAGLLKDVPGVSLYGAGGVSSLPAIHGMADDRVRTQLDGMDLTATCPNHMNPVLSYVDPSRVSAVQVYAGVTPVSVGGDSIGGSIVVESAPPTFSDVEGKLLTQGEIGGFYRSNGHVRGTHAGATVASEQLSVNYQGSAVRADNYRAADDFKTDTATGRPDHTLDLDEVGSTAYEAINQSLQFGLRTGSHLFDLKWSHQNIPYENFPNQRMDMTGNHSDQINFSYTGQRDWGVFKARIYRDITHHEMDFGDDKRFWYGSASLGGYPCSPLSMSCAAGMPMYSKSNTTGAKISGDILLSDLDVLRVGTEYLSYHLNDWWTPSGAAMWPGTFWNVHDGERDRYALFAEWERHWSERWDSSLGLRQETVRMNTGDVRGYSTATTAMGSQYTDALAFNSLDHQRTDNNWDLTLLARFTPSATQRYEVALAQKTRSPNLYERYTWSTWAMAAVMNNFVGDGNGYVGNADLSPEVARTLSLTADWHDAAETRWQVKVSPYYTRVEDFIDAACNTLCAPDQFNVLRFVNQSAHLFGADVSGQVSVTDSPRYGQVSLNALVNYSRGLNTETHDNLYNIMPMNEKLTLTHKLGGWTGAVEAQFVDAKEHVSRVRNEIPTKAYSLVNVRGSYEWQKVRLDVGVDNLFDRFYRLPLGGAYLGQGTTMSLNGIPWGIAMPGPARSVYTALTIKI